MEDGQDETLFVDQEAKELLGPKVCTLCDVEYPYTHIARNYENEKFICHLCWNETGDDGQRHSQRVMTFLNGFLGVVLEEEHQEMIARGKRAMKTKLDLMKEQRACR